MPSPQSPVAARTIYPPTTWASDNINSMLPTNRPNGNIEIRMGGVNAQVYTSRKVLKSGVLEVTVQVNITGSALSKGSDYSNRYGVTNGEPWKAPRRKVLREPSSQAFGSR